MKSPIHISLLLFFISCSTPQQPKLTNINPENLDAAIPFGAAPVSASEQLGAAYDSFPPNTLAARFAVPSGFRRIAVEEASFAEYLRLLPLKASGELVNYYNGKQKPNRGVYAAVVNLPIGKRDLHQCADAVMRLRAEYLWKKGDYEQIHFNFTNGFRVDYSKWMQGKRVAIEGNKTWWVQRGSPANTYKDFWKYLEIVFSYAGTASLEKELHTTPIEEIAIGDVFIQGGFPGHAVIVVDMAENPSTKEVCFMLAQSYMPAQELQILHNPRNSELSPWYTRSSLGSLVTPEWTFEWSDLKRFGEE